MAVSLASLFPTLRSHSRADAGQNPVPPSKRRNGSARRAAAPRPSAISFETIEPRVLLSADLSVAAAGALAGGLDAFNTRFDAFLGTDSAIGERVPILLTVKTGPNNTLINEAPSVGDLFSVPVDANHDGQISPFDDESALQGLDVSHGTSGPDGQVTSSEFLDKWFFEPIHNWLNSHGGSGTTTQDFVNFLEGGFLNANDHTLDNLSGLYKIEFQILDVKVSDTTQEPDAEVTFTAGFELKVTRNAAPIDLGLEADALKILPFAQVGGQTLDEIAQPQAPTIPVTSTLDFAFDFGVLTGGQVTIDANDFFIRKAEPLTMNVTSNATNLNFNLNIGFLGAKVNNGSIDLQAEVDAKLLDPNDPAVLGFTDAQRGVEQTNGVVTAVNAVLKSDLDHEAGFFLRIGNLGIATPVKVTDDNNNVSLTDLKTDIESALTSAGLSNLIGVNLVGAGSDTVQFALKPTLSNNPLGFANETYGVSGTLVASSIIGTPAGNGGTAFEYAGDQTFLLSIGGAVPKLVTVTFADPSHTDIGFNDGQAAAVPPLVAPSAPSVFDISADAGFTVTVWKNDGTSASSTITLHATDTDGNTNATDLAADIDNAFNGSAVYPLVVVEASGGHIRWRALDPTLVSAIRVQASGTAISEIGLAADTKVGLQLLAANNSTADLTEAANFKLTLNDNGATNTYFVTVPDNNRGSLTDLAADINTAIDAAIGSDRISVVVSGSKILLYGVDVAIRSFSVKTINQDINDLVADVNRALGKAGLGGQVTASNAGGKLQLQAPGNSLEISKTLTFDAGRTVAELQTPILFGDPPALPLFGASKGTSSHVKLNLPVEILDGLDDATTPAVDNWKPANVAIVGNFSPFDADSAVSDYDGLAKRFNLKFTLDPVPPAPATPPAVDPPAASVPSVGSLTDKIVLVNFAEPLNFNLIGAESMIGLVSSLGTALEQIANSQPFANFDIPFVGPNVANLFNFADSDKKNYSGLLDMLVYDTGGPDGFGGSNDAPGLLKKVTVDSKDKFVPNFSTAQKLAKTLSSLLGVGMTGANGINATYDHNSNQLTYRVDLLAKDRSAPTQSNTPFEYDVPLMPFAKLTVNATPAQAGEDKTVDLNGRTGLQMTFGIDLSPSGAILLSSTKLADLQDGAGIGVKVERAITGTKDIEVVPAPGPNQPTKDPVFQLKTGDATFSLSINGAAAVEVTVFKASTFNRSMSDLVEDVNNALAAKGIDKVVADYDGRRLVLTAKPHDTTTTFSITASNTVATNELGLIAGTSADQADFVIFDRSYTGGATGRHAITLDGLSSSATIQNLFDLIKTQTAGHVEAEFNGAHTGLRLIDKTLATNSALNVQTTNNSIALLRLGLLVPRQVVDANNNVIVLNPNLATIEGGAIGSKIDLSERFFVRQAQMRIDGLSVATKPSTTVPGQGLFGMVGVDTQMSGRLDANISAWLQNPSTKLAGGEVTLKQLFNKTDVLANPTVDKGQQITFSSQIGGPFQKGTRIVGSVSHATAVIVDVGGGVLQLADVEGAFQSGEFITPTSSKAPLVSALTTSAVTTNTNFGDFTLKIHVQDGFNDVGFGTGFALLNGKNYTVPVQLTGFGHPAYTSPVAAAAAPTANVDLSGIGDLAQFKNLTYDNLKSALTGLLKVLNDVNGSFALLNTKLPAINKSVGDLLGLVDGFASGVANASAAFDAATKALSPDGSDIPALRLQDLPRALRSAFGLPSGADTVDPGTPGAVDWVKLDFDKVNKMLLVDLALNEAVDTKLGLDIAVDSTLPNITSGGVLQVNGKLDVRLNFGIDLSTPSNAYLFDTSNIAAALKVVGEGEQYAGGQAGLGMVLRAALGPLAVFIQDGSALIDASFKLPGLNLAGGKKLISSVVFADWKPAVINKQDIAIMLPMFYGGEGPNNFIGEFTATGLLSSPVVTAPNFSQIKNDIVNGVVPFDPFSNILLAVDGLDIYLQTLTDTLSSDVLGINLPLVGTQMADALFIEDFRSTLIRTLKNGIENAINPNPNTIVQDLLTNSFAVAGVTLTMLASPNNNPNDPNPANRRREWNFKLTGTKNITVDDFVLGINNLGFDLKDPVSVQLVWTATLGFGVDFANSAYVVLPNGTDDIDLKLEIKLPALPSDGQLGYLPLVVTDPGNDTGAKLDFDVDVKDGSTSKSVLPYSDLGSINPVATVKGSDLSGNSHLASLFLVTDASPGLPAVQTGLIIDWSLAAGTQVSSLHGDAVGPGVQKIMLDDVKVDAGSVAKELLGPAFNDIANFIKPFIPVIDTLSAAVPILSDIAGKDITLLDLAAVFGSSPPQTDFIKAVADIFDVISALNSFITAPLLPLGDLTVYEKGVFESAFKPNVAGYELSGVPITPGTNVALDGNFNNTINGNGFLKDVRDGKLADGLTMPILTDQLEGFKLLLNKPATMIEYALPPLEVDFSYRQYFPVTGPLGVSITISFGFGLDLHGVGFDTYGYQRYADGGFRNPGVIFDGFFFDDLDKSGADAPEVQMQFGLIGAAELNAGAARAGVQGGIDAIILFNWHDSIPDTHIHLSEIAGNIAAANNNPLAAFDVSGKLTFSLSAFIEITLIGFHLDIPITGEQTLYSFDASIARKPILGKMLGDTLQLNMGPNAKDRLNGDTSDGNEVFNLEYAGNGKVYVWSDKLGVGYSDKQPYEGVKNIVGLGGQGDDVIELDKFDGSKITGDFDGGIGDDRIEYKGSTQSNDWVGAVIRGGLGNDTLIGGDANDTIYGGEGNDTVKGAGGYDILFGDDGRVASGVTPSFITSRVTETDGDDKIEGGAGDDVLIGAGGNDDLKGDGGKDILIGDGGRFEYTTTGAGNHVNVASLRPAAYVPSPVDTGTPKTPEQISKDIDVLYDFVVGKFIATDLGVGGNDTLAGGGDDDLMLGGSGDDTMMGEDGADVMLGGKGFDQIKGGKGNDTIFGGDQADTIEGNEDDDVISGGAGNDFVHGNDGKDVMKGDAGADVMFGDAGDDQVFGLTEPDVLFGGTGNDLVVGGTGNDIIFGDDGLVAKLDPANGSANIVIGNGSASLITGAFRDGKSNTLDLIVTDVVAGDGNDILSGEAGDDIVLGGGGNDRIGGDVDPRLPSAGTPTPISNDVLIGDGGKVTFNERQFAKIETLIAGVGAPYDDTIYGDNGNDYILGGQGSDILFGGHGKVVTDVATQTLGAFRGATDGNASDNDIIVGDNGEMIFADKTSVDGNTGKSNFGKLERVRTTDTTNATGGHEYAEGELGDDVIFGGVNASVDVLFGSAGNDVILGDNGLLDFDFNDTAHDLTTLDLIRSFRDNLGGIDEISGNAGNDVLIGGTAGDRMYGDDATASAAAADGEDIMLGDNADIFLIGTTGRLKVRVASMPAGTAVDLITTTDSVDSTGGADTMSGNAGNDIMLGGVNNGEPDVMYGDRASPTAGTIANDGNDILLGDNGLLDFTFGTDIDRNTLDLIRSAQDGLGGTDTISGNKGLDVAIGGTGGDTIYGDDATFTAGAADLADILIGDNADIFLMAKGNASGGDLKEVLGVAVQTIRTTDQQHPEYGGSDTISGNAGGDIILGGVQGDTLYGDRQAVTTATNTNDGNDIILGDNGALEWQSNGRLSEISGIDINANNAALWTKFGAAAQDLDLTTLDLITTEQPTNGGRDLIYGDNGRDVIFGGTDADTLYGDTGSETDVIQSANGNDLMFGDHGRLYVQFSTLANIYSRNFFAIDIGNGLTADNAGGQGDRMWGEEGDDIMLGQQGDDRMWGGSGNDDMIGGHNVSGGYDELTAGAIGATLKTPDNGMNDLMDGGSGDDAMTGDNAIVWRRGDDLSPRFRLLTQTTIYTTAESTITANVGAQMQSDPNDAVGRDIQLIDHSDAVEANPLGRFGKDVMAGGAGNDTMFGELGDDLMQGDGSIATTLDSQPATRSIVVTDSAGPTGQQLYFNVPEAATDGDDYMEGNGGRDLMYGGLGQDDMIGGSSSLFGLITEDLRPDDSDTMFGGAGIDTGRNNLGDATQDTNNVITPIVNGHARDADFIMGDNANVYRLVKGGASGTNPNDPNDLFLSFNFDDAYGLQLVPRAMQQLDYTLGGADYNGGTYTAAGQATPTGKPTDNGAADLIHGESGDDIIFGMTGSDVLFGDGQDDDIVGGYGNDWISGGTGQDGVLGDDGLVLTSRNSSTYGEPLYGIAALLASDPDTKFSNGNVLNEAISTPGSIQTAIINVANELKKTFDVVPFSYDKNWIGIDDEFPNNSGSAPINTPFADDIIFGGLGSDWLHGGSGDDAISGAEALDHAYVPTYDNTSGNANGTFDLGFAAVGIANALVVNQTHQNPGNVLAFNPIDTDGRHLNNRFRAGEFRLYDEYDPLRKILLTGTGELSKDGTGLEFLLNFNKDEGVVRPAGTVPKSTGQQATDYPQVNDDGADAIFGDLGNDWMVGGTGRDDAYGGWGNDLINVDDNQDTNNKLNDQPDTHPTYEDRAYGGAGRDVLIANTGGDRLIDWVGEYNSYLVPFAPFGMATVSRTLQPQLQDFLYALSKADGADPTRVAYVGDPRNGEPRGEMGLVLQKDQAWQDQTGAPSDPQAGNIPGGKRDVLRSADFTGNQAQGFVSASGSWTVTNDRYEVSPLAGSGTTDAISLYNVDAPVPTYFEVAATINSVKPLAGFKGNAYIVFDYQSPTNFKFAGIDISNNKIEIGQRNASGWQVLASANALLKQDIDYNALLAVNGNAVTFVLDNAQSLSYAFSPRTDTDGFTYNIRDGMIGLGADNGKARIDDVRVQVIPPTITYAANDPFSGTSSTLLTAGAGTWSVQNGRFIGNPATGAPFALAANDISVGLNSLLKVDAVVNTASLGGIVFDVYTPTDFKWAAVSVATNQVLVGHYTAKSGWVVDAAVSRTLSATTDYALSVTLKGSTVNVTLNGQTALSKVYNSDVVDGAIGVFSRNGSASFDSFGLSTDDAKLGTSSPSGLTGTKTAATVRTSGAETTSSDSSIAADPVRINWRLSSGLAGLGLIGDWQSLVRTEAWQQDFVLSLGQRLASNPNEGLRIRL